MRLFVALDIPDEIKRELVSLQATSLEKFRWQSSAQIHLTLAFIGDVDDKLYEKVSEELEDIQFTQFPLVVKSAGQFGSEDNPRVLWMGLKDEPNLLDLQSEVTRILESNLIPFEKKKFVPHITVARGNGKGPKGDLSHFFTKASQYTSKEFTVSAFHLFRSKLNHEGAQYEILQSYELY